MGMNRVSLVNPHQARWAYGQNQDEYSLSAFSSPRLAIIASPAMILLASSDALQVVLGGVQ